MTEPINWRKQLAEIGGYDNELVGVPAGTVRKMVDEIDELRAALAQKDEAITYHENHFANLKIEYDDLYDEHEKLEAALAAPREPMTPHQIFEAVHDADLDWQRGFCFDGTSEVQRNRYVDLVRAVEAHITGGGK